MTEEELNKLLAEIEESQSDAVPTAPESGATTRGGGLLGTDAGVIAAPTRRGDCPPSLKIQRLAISQNYVDISERITKEHYRLLCALLNYHYTKRRIDTEERIKKAVTRVLSSLIPAGLVRAYAEYPQYVKAAPPFIYHAGDKYGEGKSYEMKLELPYYIRQGTEQAAITDNTPQNLLARIDELVALYHRYREHEVQTERLVANVVYGQRRSTYYAVVRARPQWFYHLYNELKRRKDNECGDA